MTVRPEQRVRLEARRHGIVLARPLLRALLLAGCGAALVLLGWPWSVPGAAALALAALAGLRAAVRWERTVLVVTTDRLVVEHGLFRRRRAAAPLAGAVEVEQTLLGRVLGYATVVAGDLEVPYVPREVVRLVQ